MSASFFLKKVLPNETLGHIILHDCCFGGKVCTLIAELAEGK